MRGKGQFPAWLRRRRYTEVTKERIARAMAGERVTADLAGPHRDGNVIPFLLAQIVRRGTEASVAKPLIRNVIVFPPSRMLPAFSAMLPLAYQVGVVGSYL